MELMLDTYVCGEYTMFRSIVHKRNIRQENIFICSTGIEFWCMENQSFIIATVKLNHNLWEYFASLFRSLITHFKHHFSGMALLKGRKIRTQWNEVLNFQMFNVRLLMFPDLLENWCANVCYELFQKILKWWFCIGISDRKSL